MQENLEFFARTRRAAPTRILARAQAGHMTVRRLSSLRPLLLYRPARLAVLALGNLRTR
jgi:hypothetical protein